MANADVIAPPTPYESASELKDAHASLLDRLDQELARDSSAEGDAAITSLESDIRLFLKRGAASGVYLEEPRDRTACGALLDYWVSSLAQAGLPAASSRLAPFDGSKLPDLKGTNCPFVGLDAFRQEDQPYFFGRDSDSKKLVALVRSTPLVVVVGESGSGKSSLVMSGVLPRLAAGEEGVQFRVVPPIVPGNDVIGHLTAALHGSNPAAPPGDDADLRTAPAAIVALLGGPAAPPAVITIDQFEEVFTLSTAADRDALVAALVELLKDSRHRVILTVRVEFRSQITALRALEPFLGESAWYAMRPMGYEDLRDAVEKPAALAKLQFQAGVVDDLVKRVLGQQAALPLLQFTLRTLWDRRDRNRITWEVYRKVGNPLDALPAAADAFYKGLTPQARDETKRILLELVRVDELLEAYRQPLPKKQLLRAGKANTEETLALLAKQEFIRITADTGGEDVVEVKHEALIRNWPEYVSWIDEKRRGQRQRLALGPAAERWHREGRPDAQLLTGWQLEDAKTYSDLGALEAQFVAASVSFVERAQREREKQLVKAARRKANVRLVVVGAALSIVAIIAGAFWLQRERITLLAELAGARRLAEDDPTAGATAIAQAIGRHRIVSRLADSRGWLDALLNDARVRPVAIGAMFSLGDQALATGRFTHPRLTRALLLPDGATLVTSDDSSLRFWTVAGMTIQTHDAASAGARVQDLVIDTNGHVSAVWSDGVVRRFDARGQRQWEVKTGRAFADAAFSRDGRRLFVAISNDDPYQASTPGIAYAMGDGAVDKVGEVTVPATAKEVVPNSQGTEAVVLASGGASLWNVAANTLQPLEFKSPSGSGKASKGGGLPITIWWAAFSPTDRHIGAIDVDGVGWVVPVGGAPRPAVRLNAAVGSMAFGPRGNLVATASEKGPTRLWTVDGEEYQQPRWPSAPATSVAFGETFDWVATTANGITQVMAIDGPMVMQFKGHPGGMTSVRFFGGDKTIVTGSDDGTVRLWTVDSRVAKPVIAQTDTIQSIEMSTDGRRAVTASLDKTVRVWDVASQREIARITHDDYVRHAAFSPRGDLVVASSVDSTAQIWNLDGKPIGTAMKHNGAVVMAAFSADGESVLTASEDGTARRWNLQGQVTATLEHKEPVIAAAFLPDGSLLTASMTAFHRWSREGRLEQTFGSHPGFGEVVLSADGRYILSGAEGGRARVYSSDGTEILNLDLGRTAFHSGAISAGSQFIATVGKDGRVRFWNLGGELLGEMTTLGYQVTRLTFAPDSKRLITVSTDHLGRLWPLTLREYAEHLRGLGLPCLKAPELRDGLLFSAADAAQSADRCQSARTGR